MSYVEWKEINPEGTYQGYLDYLSDLDDDARNEETGWPYKD